MDPDAEYFGFNQDLDNYNNDFIGGFLEGYQNNKRLHLSPETSFYVDLNKSYDFLQHYISKSDFEYIKSTIPKYKHFLFKNPALILLSNILINLPKNNPDDLFDPIKLKNFYSNPDILPIIKENNISQYEIIKYCRYIALNINKQK